MSKLKIAVIEDEKPILDMYLLKLIASGFEAKGAQDGEEGLSLIKSLRPDMILLDLRMPKMSGQELLSKLRQTGDSTLVIVLTNLSPNEASLDMRLLKVEKYIVKAHSTPSQVVEEVKSSLRRHGLLDRAAS
jgi:DNA-binding response OmpR family regulator